MRSVGHELVCRVLPPTAEDPSRPHSRICRATWLPISVVGRRGSYVTASVGPTAPAFGRSAHRIARHVNGLGGEKDWVDRRLAPPPSGRRRRSRDQDRIPLRGDGCGPTNHERRVSSIRSVSVEPGRKRRGVTTRSTPRRSRACPVQAKYTARSVGWLNAMRAGFSSRTDPMADQRPNPARATTCRPQYGGSGRSGRRVDGVLVGVGGGAIQRSICLFGQVVRSATRPANPCGEE